MTKKNTLLYLEDDLVKAAKQYGLNISKITEDAIKSNLFPVLSMGKRIELDFESYIKSLEGEKRAFFLPFEIKGVKLSDIGPHKDIDVNFKRFNIIAGKNGSGKTFLIRSIAFAVDFKDPPSEDMIREGLNKGEIVLKISKGDSLSIKLEKGKGLEKNYKCLLLDDPLGKLDSRVRKKILDYLKKLNVQIILTSLPMLELNDKSFNIIMLK